MSRTHESQEDDKAVRCCNQAGDASVQTECTILKAAGRCKETRQRPQGSDGIEANEHRKKRINISDRGETGQHAGVSAGHTSPTPCNN